MLHNRGDRGNDCRDNQNDNHRVGELLQQTADEGLFLSLLQFVFAVFRETLLRLGGG